MNEYENVRRISYGFRDNIGVAQFIPVCIQCSRFVKPDKSIKTNEITGLIDKPNATCKKCGRTKMLFEGFF